MKRNIPTITINNPNKPINISVPNTGGGSGNPFVNWTGNTGNFGNIGNPTTNISTFNPPNMNIPNNIPTGNITQNTISNTNQTNTISGAIKENQILGKTNNTNKINIKHNGSNLSEEVSKINNFIDTEWGCKHWGSNVFQHGKNIKGQVESEARDIKVINLAGCQLDHNNAESLFYRIGRCNFDFKLIDLSNNNISNEGVISIINGISGINYQTIIDPIKVTSVTSNTFTIQKVQHLNLSNCNIGDTGASYIAKALSDGKLASTNQINLSGNKITDTGTVTIAEALKTGKFPTLKRLDVSGNDTSLVTEKFMLDALKHPSTQSIILLLKRSNDLKVVLSGSKEEKQKLIKTILQTAQDNGVDVKNVAVSKGVLGFLDNLGYVISDFSLGFTKCNIVPEDAETFAMEAVTAKISKKAIAANTAKDAVVCLFDTIDDVLTSYEGIQLIKDLDLYGANSVIDSIE